MEELLKFLEPSEIAYIYETDDSLKEVEDIDIKEIIDTLKSMNIKDSSIKDAILQNSYLLERTKEELMLLFSKLASIDIKDYDDLIMRNPNILSLEPFEIDDFLIEKRKMGYDIEDILEMIREGQI